MLLELTSSLNPGNGGRRAVDFFICHAHEDGDFAELLKMKIEQAGYSAWVDTERLQAGNDWRIEIDDGIRYSCCLIVILSPIARKSEYVTYEWAFAWGMGINVLPIVIKQTSMHPRLETLQYLDFTNRLSRPWDRLLEILKAYHERRSNG
jgi:hypothetical protein